MEWCKLYARMPSDVAIQRAEAQAPGAGWLFVLGMCYVTEEESDGFIPTTQIARFSVRNAYKKVQALVTNTLWITVEGGWHIRSWVPIQNPDSVRKKREADRNRQAEKREESRTRVARESHKSRSVEVEQSRSTTPNPTDVGGCGKHPDKPGSNCRGCGTNLRSINGTQRKPPSPAPYHQSLAERIASINAEIGETS